MANSIDTPEGFAKAMREAERAAGIPSDRELYGSPRRPPRPDDWDSYFDEHGSPQEIHPLYKWMSRYDETVTYGCGEKPRQGRVLGYLLPGDSVPRPRGSWR